MEKDMEIGIGMVFEFSMFEVINLTLNADGEIIDSSETGEILNIHNSLKGPEFDAEILDLLVSYGWLKTTADVSLNWLDNHVEICKDGKQIYHLIRHDQSFE
jgi:hypothetical protein